jgi:hypothetical protein
VAQIPDWLLGRGITALQITPKVFSGGVLVTPTLAAPIDFFTVVDGIEYEHEVELLDVAPTRSRQRNMVIVSTGATFTVTEILRRSQNAGGQIAFNSLAALFHAYDYFRLQFSRGAGQSYGFYGVNAGYRERIERGKCVGEGRFGPVGTVEAGVSVSRNPTYP